MVGRIVVVALLMAAVAGCAGNDAKPADPAGRDVKAPAPPGSTMPPRNIATH